MLLHILNHFYKMRCRGQISPLSASSVSSAIQTGHMPKTLHTPTVLILFDDNSNTCYTLCKFLHQGARTWHDGY